MGASEVPGETRRVLVVGGRRLVGEALVVLMDRLPGISAAAIAASEVEEAVQRSAADAVVVPTGDDLLEGRAAAEAVSAAVPGARVVLLVPPPVRLWERMAADAGWRVVSLDDDVASIEWGVGTATAARRPSPGGPADGGTDLTPREIEVLRSLAAGLRPDAISLALGVSPHTVRSHIRNLTTKLGVRSRLEAVAAGRLAGYLLEPRAGARTSAGEAS